MPLALGVIADDFTGATDIAGLIARRGVKVGLRAGVPEGPAESEAEVEVIALKCRTVPVGEALAMTGAALDWLRRAGAERIFWKYCSTFDSTAEGNIGPVAEALLAALGAKGTVYCPAFPENGRTIYKGHLFVGDMLLSESPMKDHPLTPMRDSSLARLLSPQVRGPVGAIGHEVVRQGQAAVRAAFEELVAGGRPNVVTDAITGADLDVLAGALGHLPLLTGGSALGAALFAARADAAPPRPPAGTAEGPAVVLSGSCSAATRGQVAAWRESGGRTIEIDPFRLPEGSGTLEAEAVSAMAEAPVLVTSTMEPDRVRDVQEQLGRETASERIEAATAAVVRATRAAGATRFVVAGGETSGAVLGALAARQMTVGREIAPGVHWCYAEDEAGPMALALKSGNFGGRDVFREALALLDAEARR